MPTDASSPALDAALTTPPPRETATATFGMGCFWDPEARFGAIEGVASTRVGYAGGTTPEPTYHSLGDHTEVVQVDYDPQTLSYETLLAAFWTGHAPTTAPASRQYRSVILTTTDRQHELATQTRKQTTAQVTGSVTTAVEQLDQFYLAEDYHQKYELRSTPVLGDELVDRYGDTIVDSTVAARLNGFVAGYGDAERRQQLLGALDLPPTVLAELRRRV